jgi:glycosyltransferase involved in cell wall biosynthesis
MSRIETTAPSSVITHPRVLMVTPRYLPLMGGVENHVVQVARRLAGAGVDITVLTTDPIGSLPTRERLDGIDVHRVRSWPLNSDYHFAPGLFKVVADGPWEIVHVQSYHTFVAPFAMVAALHASIPYVVTFHGGGHSSRLRNLVRRPQRALLRPLLARADRLIAVARFERELYGRELRLPRERFVVIPNGSDFEGLPTGGVSTDGALIVSVGRLERYKGHQRILAAFPDILRRRPDARLWIAGEGPYEAVLRDLAQRLGVSHAVEIRSIPAGERERMAVELGRAALVVLLSDFETHPLAALEAVALGKRLLVADTSGLRELAEDGLARAIQLGSAPDEIAAAALEELDRPANRAPVELPTWDQCASALLDLYEAVARPRQ